MDTRATPGVDRAAIERLAERVGTPFYLYDGDEIRRRVQHVRSLMNSPHLQPRYAMKACSARPVLDICLEHGVWLDTVSGNEVLRARRAGFEGGFDPPEILFTADVFRDDALRVIVENRILVTIGTPQMVPELATSGFAGPVGIRLNPGFGHGHVKQCDTGGPASKHGVWFEDEPELRRLIAECGLKVTLLHAHIGTGPEIAEFRTNIARLADFFCERVREYPDLEAVNFGGGIPYPYRPGAPRIDLEECVEQLRKARTELSARAGREIRVEMEPGRHYVAPGAGLVTRVRGRKTTRTNERGPGHTFVMVDAGFCDLVRPAMYGSYHRIDVLGKTGGDAELEPQVVAGPLCESGDVFTRESDELLDPRSLPRAEAGDLLLIHDAGAYGYSMSSNYNSIGRPPQVWIEGGRALLITRRETVEDIVRTECAEEL